MITFQEYLNVVHKEFMEHLGQWRLGQTYFNILHRVNPVLANQLRGGPKDPFYRDGIVQEFLDYVEGHWHDEDATASEGSEDVGG